jgi:hypothetical protein
MAKRLLDFISLNKTLRDFRAVDIVTTEVQRPHRPVEGPRLQQRCDDYARGLVADENASGFKLKGRSCCN